MLPSRDWPEITDLLVAFDPQTLQRLPVHRQEVIDKLLAMGNRRGARIVSVLPVDAVGVLDPAAVDQALLTAHREMQILSEEFYHGLRMARLLGPIINTVREAAPGQSIRALDIGCGHGYVVRWLAANARFGPDVELIGADYNTTLIAEARRLAQHEDLNCRFEAADGTRLSNPAAVQFSTGILHHFRGGDLEALLQCHERDGVQAYFHFDFQPSPLAPLGSWFFHRVRMRSALTLHDGVLSAIRAHPASRLLEAARAATPGFKVCMFSTHVRPLPLPRVFHVLLAVRPELVGALERNLGGMASRLGGWQ
ncbi:MAG: class I SAM-dependent methyltransferase [Planctomycetes bacterium]|nr:class I SAM-dependent methyltransferase [Planctomycetota bacterium]